MWLRRFLAALPPGVRRWLPYWLLSAGVFVVGATVGGAVGSERSTTVLFPVRASGSAPPAPGVVELFVHNLRVAAMLVAGTVLAAVPTVYLLLFNGFALGSTLVDAAGTLGPLVTLALVAPHGVVELPALWLAGAVPFRLLHVVWSVASGGDRATSVPRVLARTAVAVATVVFLLAVAAVVEATVTAALARLL